MLNALSSQNLSALQQENNPTEALSAKCPNGKPKKGFVKIDKAIAAEFDETRGFLELYTKLHLLAKWGKWEE